MTVFLNIHYLNFKQFANKNDYEMFTIVKNKKNRKIQIDGDCENALKHLQEIEKRKRCSTFDWVPAGPNLVLPLPFEDLIKNPPDKLKQFCSVLLHRYLQPKQKLGEVQFIDNY